MSDPAFRLTVHRMATGTRQLLAFAFGTDSHFEGQLVGALERIDIGGTMRVLDRPVRRAWPESGEVTAIALSDLRRVA